MLAKLPAHSNEVVVGQCYHERGRQGRARTVRVHLVGQPYPRRPALIRWIGRLIGLDKTRPGAWLAAQRHEIGVTVVELEDMLDVFQPMTDMVMDAEMLTRRFDLVTATA